MNKCNRCGCTNVHIEFKAECAGSYEDLFGEKGWIDSQYCLNRIFYFNEAMFERKYNVYSCFECSSCGNLQGKKKLRSVSLDRCKCGSSAGYLMNIINSNKNDYVLKGKCANKKCGREISSECELVEDVQETKTKEEDKNTGEKKFLITSVSGSILFVLFVTKSIITFPIISMFLFLITFISVSSSLFKAYYSI